ncbi:hypothetical protein VE01_09290 [Pseudogymnoascus verrucosus]|uniref:Major facilitator superfamily (MFS) profile domain-containing protein n=1 Tax=Pseudogymnoascus verrucosus TaxID=342668 RepID=A0A1B8G9D0_9PEZI|nr:uncharacterized protein VE01_09290 [Pseudogymnoascus verrucosus]OBT92427.2 hypothetical protein VE01_09290 [Pseudogymnoascus verrucosus]
MVQQEKPSEVRHDEIAPCTQPAEENYHQTNEDQETAKYVGGNTTFVDEETSNALFWTVNKRILACMLGTYFCQSLDKGTLGFASIMGIQDDAHLVGQDYSWLGTILYMGVLVGEYPTNLLLQKLPVAKYVAANVFLWGIVIACSAAAKDFKSLMVVRFLLGMFESCIQPAFIIMTSMWYTKREQTVLTSLWYCMTGVQLMVGGIIAWGASHYVGHSIYSWQLLFLVLGCVTCGWAVFIGWWLPDSPLKAKCFTEDQKRMMVERVRSNDTGIQNKTYKVYQALETIKDPVIWCYIMLQITSTLVIGGLGVFSNIIIKSFGFTLLQTQLLNIAQGAVTILIMVGGATLGQTTGQTILVMHTWTIPPIIGTAVIYSITPTPQTRVGLLIAFYCTQFHLAQGNLIFSLISRNIAGQTKKSTALAMTFVAWAAGNMTAPQIFQKSDAPRYKNGFIAHFCLYVLFNIFLVVLRLLLTRRNKAKQITTATALALEGTTDLKQVDGKITHARAFDDLTDKENPDFRYVF